MYQTVCQKHNEYQSDMQRAVDRETLLCLHQIGYYDHLCEYLALHHNHVMFRMGDAYEN